MRSHCIPTHQMSGPRCLRCLYPLIAGVVMGGLVANQNQDVVVAALYRFVRLENFEAMREPLLEVCSQHNLRGTLLLAKEGINGTVSGARSDIERVLEYLRSDARLADLDCKFANHAERPFLRMKVKLKKTPNISSFVFKADEEEGREVWRDIRVK